jgi:hypothetical protein
MDWKTVAEKINQDDQSKWDRGVSGKKVRVSSNGRLEFSNGNALPDSYSLSEVATTQMCQKLEIPVKYYRRLPDEMKATVANFDIKRLNRNSYLLRGKASGYARSCRPSTWPTTIPRSRKRRTAS